MLTKREIEVLEKITQGYKTKEIAQLLFVSMSTVETHRRNIIKKLGSKNIAHAVAKAMHSKLLKFTN